MCSHNIYAVLKLWGGSRLSYNNCPKIMGGGGHSYTYATLLSSKNTSSLIGVLEVFSYMEDWLATDL